MAANPENVLPAALTEVEGIGIDGVELKFAHDEPAAEKEVGTIGRIWEGMLDSVLGPKTATH